MTGQPDSQSTLGRRETGLLAGTGGPGRTCGEEQPPDPTTTSQPPTAPPPGLAPLEATGASPRPWEIEDGIVGEVRILAADGSVICLIEMEDASWEEDVANARLIVSAVNAFHPSGLEAGYPPMWERAATGELVEIEARGGA